MKIEIPGCSLIQEQTIDVSKEVTIIYGYNNSGKTSILRVINEVMQKRMLKDFVLKQQSEMSVYIPTYRLVVGDMQTYDVKLSDLEEFVQHQKDSYQEYELHLKMLRDNLLSNEAIAAFICVTIHNIFGITIDDLNSKYSDGIENVINIYLNIIWTLIWAEDVRNINREKLFQLFAEKRSLILIDEIEMCLHVNIQTKLIEKLKNDFSNCHFLLTTHSPLILTRCKGAEIYEIENGLLKSKVQDMYYKDLDYVYGAIFSVEEFPETIKEDINYIGRVNLRREKGAEVAERVSLIAERLKKEYPNIYEDYINIIIKARNIGEEYGKNQASESTGSVGENE